MSNSTHWPYACAGLYCASPADPGPRPETRSTQAGESSDRHFSPELSAFIQATLPTVDAVELLMLLHGNPGHAWSADDLTRSLAHLRIGRARVVKQLRDFLASGIVALEGGGYRYAPRTEAVHAAVERVAAAYRERPVSLIRLIYYLRHHRFESFAEAFRITKD